MLALNLVEPLACGGVFLLFVAPPALLLLKVTEVVPFSWKHVVAGTLASAAAGVWCFYVAFSIGVTV